MAVSSFKYKGETSQPQQQSDSSGLGRNLGGIIGGTVGQIVGTPFDLVSGPAGTMAGGAIGGGLGGGVGETIDQLLGGKGLNLGGIAKGAGEQAAYGAIPVGNEMRALPLVGKMAGNLFGREAIRFGAGALGSTAAQGIEKGSVDPTQSITAGAMNALVPGIGKVLDVPSQAISKLGGIAKTSAERVLERRSIPELNAIQRLFGKESIGTQGEKSFVNPAVKQLIDKYNIPIAPKGNLADFKPALDRASQDVEEQLKPILNKVGENYQNVSSVVKNNLETFFGSTQLRSKAAQIPNNIKHFVVGLNEKLGDSPNLYQIKEAQRQIGKLVKTKDWSEPKDQADQFAIGLYRDLGDLISKKLDNVNDPIYKDLISQHKILVKARDNYGLLVKPGGVLPTELTSTGQAMERMGAGLSAQRAAELGLRMAPAVIGPAAQFTGLPKELKDLALLGSGLYGAAEFGPNVSPEKALTIAGKMQNLPNMPEGVMRALQQLGVRF